MDAIIVDWLIVIAIIVLLIESCTVLIHVKKVNIIMGLSAPLVLLELVILIVTVVMLLVILIVSQMMLSVHLPLMIQDDSSYYYYDKFRMNLKLINTFIL